MFCVECGKEVTIFWKGSCIDCYIKNHKFSNGPEIIDLLKCTHCSAYKYKNKWKNDLFDHIIELEIKNSYTISKELKKVHILTQCSEKKEIIECKITIAGFFNDIEIREEHEVEVREKKTVCDICSKRQGGYHEAIIQIRADNRKLTQEEIYNVKSTIETYIQEIQDKGNRAVFIADIGIEHGGIDFYISDKGAAFTIIKKTQDLWGGKIKQSSKNIGMKDSKQIYRMTYLLRLSRFKINDFIFHKKSFFNIVSISGKHIHVLSLIDWTEKIFELKELENADILGGNELIKDMILVSQTQKEVQIMDPNNYKNFHLKKPKNLSFNSTMVKVVKLNEEFFLLPNNRKNGFY